MKKLIIALFTIFSAVLITVSIYTFLPSEPPEPADETAVEYTVKDYGGKVAVFEKENSEPSPSSVLYAASRANGITVRRA